MSTICLFSTCGLQSYGCILAKVIVNVPSRLNETGLPNVMLIQLQIARFAGYSRLNNLDGITSDAIKQVLVYSFNMLYAFVVRRDEMNTRKLSFS